MSTDIPGHDQIKEALLAEGAPPHFILDIGNSDDLDGDGLVKVSLGLDGELVFEDA
ncbi:hypothetical protein HOT31_gp076 [Microbacterium phage Hendrix]|uniref:Uncharacterized protein n=1 Tax=Microbacterium phage Hendrix TaxID=2182341 RepID=A0A2U8UUJ0_9CAUD|nr:hypothetical protein HOT31_gp076 [Microbacterium phage Hendrix]AWN07747.1 hypothetical protein PBI_HENDRIX_76 [Microbacterium phage Hendrix]